MWEILRQHIEMASIFQSSDKMSTSKFLGGFVLGAAAGLVAGLLIAPSSGSQTRKNLISRSRNYSQQAIDAVRQYLESKGGTRKEEYGVDTEELLEQIKEKARRDY